ncbi:MAG: hypothetical protein LBR28_00465 [Bacteroidales bacterium]|jgi:hypothetical protein|nr:hypothetical protein [Bacteroidales bacterium]
MNPIRKKLLNSVAGIFVLVTLLGNSHACASKYSRHTAREVIRKTAYIIDEAYDIVNYYNYWNGSSLSKAIYFNDYAQDLYRHRNYRQAINYSLTARQYAVNVINSCDDYWEYFFYTYFGWSYYYGYNSSYNAGYANGYRNGYYDAYYRSYCNRYDHYDNHYNPNGHNHHKDPSDYDNNGGNRNTVTIGRGISGATSGGNISNNGKETPTVGSNTASFKDISINQYFDTDEQKLIKDLPTEISLENDYKVKNPNTTFDDAQLSKNTTVIEVNRTTAKEFNPNSNKETTNLQLAKPAKVTSERPVKATTTTVSTKNTVSPATNINVTSPKTNVIPNNEMEIKKDSPVKTTDKPAIQKNNNSTKTVSSVEKENSTTKANTKIESTKKNTTSPQKQTTTAKKQITTKSQTSSKVKSQ